MTTSSPPQKAKSSFQNEMEELGVQLKRLANCLLNKIFDLTIKGSQRRKRMLIFLFLLLGFIFTLRIHELSEWRIQIGSLFQYLFNVDYARQFPDTFTTFLNFAFGAIIAPQTLRFLPIFIIPFVIALQSAAIYLADIFELQEVNVAREFITQVALTGSQKSIRIGNGEVAESDKNSPIYLIGGPGQVLVELDSAVLFEKPDGRPHVIGPSVNGKATLEGFERFRQVIDLRDQYTDLHNPVDVNSRSLDGIPVGTKDVRFVYSVWRGDKPRTAKSPHPYGSDKTIEDLVYKQASKVVDAVPPSVPPEAGSLSAAIIGLIHRELDGFMSKHRLAEYLASIGIPEVEQARKLEDEIAKAGNKVVPESDPVQPREVPNPPVFQPRNTISDLFNQFTEGFESSANNPGVQLQWIGVGTWKMPTKITDEIITEKHLEAWRISRENFARGNPTALNQLRQEARLQQTIRLIQSVPLGRFQQNDGVEHRHRVKDLLIAYRQQLIEAVELLRKSKKPIPISIPRAIEYIENVLAHWVGK